MNEKPETGVNPAIALADAEAWETLRSVMKYSIDKESQILAAAAVLQATLARKQRSDDNG